MTDLEKFLKEVKERESKATEGPWKWEDWSEDNGTKETTLAALPHTREGGISDLFPDLGNCLLKCEEEPDNKNDKHFIAHARQDIPKLVKMIELVYQHEHELDHPELFIMLNQIAKEKP